MYHRVKLRRKKQQRKRLLRWIALTVLLLCLALASDWEIRDGEQRYSVLALFQSPRSIAAGAGIALDPLDYCRVRARGGGWMLTVDRAPIVTVRDHGYVRQVSSRDADVGALLVRLGIPFTSDQVTPVPDTPVTDGMTVCVDRMESGVEVYTGEIPAGAEYLPAPELPENTERILQPGSSGEERITAQVDYRNGMPYQRRILSREVLREPQSAVILQGTGEPEPDQPVIRGSYICLPDGQQLHFTDTARIRVSAFTEPGVHYGTAAADPRVIPYGTRMYIAASDGSYFYGIAQSRNFGRQVTGNHVEVYLPTTRACIDFGVKDCTAYFLG